MFRYKAKVVRVYDGDTIRVNIDLGFGLTMGGDKGESLRLYGINAPEVRGKSKSKGKESRDYLRSVILGKYVIIETIKDKKGKYGRYLAKVFITLEDDTILNLNKDLVSRGYAIEKKY